MTTPAQAYDDVIQALWDRDRIRRLAQEFAGIATAALASRDDHVRRPGAQEVAANILRRHVSASNLGAIVRDIQEASLHLSHPRYLAHQVAAPIPAAALVESVVAALNQSLAVWEMSPIATAIDRNLMARFKRLFGYPQGAEGSLVPGGAFGNLTALLAARDSLEPGASRSGRARIAVVAGAQTHYTVSRAAAILGLGSDAVFTVPLDREFCTDVARVPDAFRAARRAGFRKFILIGTAGSTPTGSTDNLVQLHQVARKERAWFHVDAAHGAGLAFSRRLRRRLKGISLADSITFDPHKMMFMPLSAGGVLVRDGSCLAGPLNERAPYLFGIKRCWPDIGQITISCSQRFDALKVWVVWRAYGAEVWDALTTHACDLARAAYRYCSHSGVLEPAHRPHSNIFCFKLRNHGGDAASDRLHWAIKEELNESGFAYISSAVLDGSRVLRLVVMNPRTAAEDVYSTLERVEDTAMTRAQRSGGTMPVEARTWAASARSREVARFARNVKYRVKTSESSNPEHKT